MILVSALLFFVCFAGIVWYFGSEFVERQIVLERIKNLTGRKPSFSQTKSELLKPEFYRDKQLRRFFDFKSLLRTPQTAAAFLAWAGLSFFLMVKLPAAPILKLFLSAAFLFILMRFIKVASIRRGKEQMERELPGTLDLIVICLESGLGINSAFLRVSNEMEASPLGRELRQTFNEISAGSPLDAALRNFAKRVDIPDLNAVVVAVIQAQKMGTAIAATFRIQAESIREQYKMKMKEKILKMPIKILFPLLFFVFPAIFVVILGPPIVSIAHFFSQNK